MTDRYERIRVALANGPTPGSWDVEKCRYGFAVYASKTGDAVVKTEDVEGRYGAIDNEADARLIAACDPDTTSELIAERDALAAKVERLAEALRGWWKAHRPVGWTEHQHRSCPHVNLVTPSEKALADAMLREQEEGK